MNMKRDTSSGFTLIETIVVAALTAFVMLAIGYVLQYFYKTNLYVLQQSQAVRSARLSVENTVANLREASYGADGAYPMAAAATSTVTFYAAVGTTTVEKVRYYISGDTLYRGVTAPGGNPPTYAGQPEETTLVVDNIRNGTTPMFTYYDASGNALSEPVDVSKVASVRIEVLTDVNPLRAPDVYTLTGVATLRNVHNMNE